MSRRLMSAFNKSYIYMYKFSRYKFAHLTFIKLTTYLICNMIDQSIYIYIDHKVETIVSTCLLSKHKNIVCSF